MTREQLVEKIAGTLRDARLEVQTQWEARTVQDDARAVLAAIEGAGFVIAPRRLLVEAHACMRETGWHLAPACDGPGDGVLAVAVADVEDRFTTLLNHRPASPVAAKEGT